MEEALQAAVSRMNSTTPEPAGGHMDPMGAIVAVLPKLLQSAGAGEETIERIEALQKDDLTPLRGQVQVLRKQCFRMLKSQERLLAKVNAIQRQQAAVADAVLDLARQMARLTFIDDVPAGYDDHEREAPAPGSYGRADLTMGGRNGRGRQY
jgi:hypothetical protein